ncbi:MAG: hypothetical protein M1826_005526 [Phylliscum demangeonii]|nr:MAG: hypothetical protein M1826_005526 [Phylliscum demangeonii]
MDASVDRPTSGSDALPIFRVERVQLQFTMASDFVAAQVADNVLILALSTGRLLRIDLDNPAEIDDIDLPKKTSDVGPVRRMFLDPTASHLLVSTTLGENFYLHSQSRQPRPLARLKGVPIESVAWNPSRPTASTREILVGAADGNVYELYIEPATEFYRREEKYLRAVYKIPDGPVTGLWVGPSATSAAHRVFVASPSTLRHFEERNDRAGNEGGPSAFAKLFASDPPTTYHLADARTSAPSAFVLSPDESDSTASGGAASEQVYAWLSSVGIVYGPLSPSQADATAELGDQTFAASNLLPRARLPTAASPRDRRQSGPQAWAPITAIALTPWHVLALVDGRMVAVNRLNEEIVFDQPMLDPGRAAVALMVDQKKSTFWLVTAQHIFEIVTHDEDRDVWRIMLKRNDFDRALTSAKIPAHRDAVATAYGDSLLGRGKYMEAAALYGRSSKPFEQVSLAFIDHQQHDALRRYLLTKLSAIKKSSIMQRTMVASWLVELYMSKLDGLDDTVTTNAEIAENTSTAEAQEQIVALRTEFQEFAVKYKTDLDQRTTCELISSHGREEELLYYATLVQDYHYVLAYWIQRERWPESLAILKKQTDPDPFYKYGSVLMSHVPTEFIDIVMRQSTLEPKKLIPALLTYNEGTNVSLSHNQAARYLQFAINQLQTEDAAIHNTLVSIYAAHPAPDESALLAYVESQSHQAAGHYDVDFALRLCLQHNRVQSCVHLYSSMGQYLQAVELALQHDEIELASIIADRPEGDPSLRRKLWLAVAKQVISQSDGIKTAIKFLRRCELLRIEDLIPFFPDFVVIDDFKEEICTALEEYSRQIDLLKREMDESSHTAATLQTDIAALEHRYAIVEPGEGCYLCRYPLLSRPFFVFPCQHAFHADCLATVVMEHAGVGVGRRLKELQMEVGRGGSTGTGTGTARDRAAKELDSLVAASCILCGDFAVKQIDQPFVLPTDPLDGWAL